VVKMETYQKEIEDILIEFLAEEIYKSMKE
jgi:hypothetical protein